VQILKKKYNKKESPYLLFLQLLSSTLLPHCIMGFPVILCLHLSVCFGLIGENWPAVIVMRLNNTFQSFIHISMLM